MTTGLVQYPTNAQLAHELDRLGVPFVRSAAAAPATAPLPPAHLLAGLACNDEARLRLALIPLLLTHPAYASHAPDVATGLSPQPRLTFICYYTAAWLLQQHHRVRLLRLFGEQPALPDYFSAELALPVVGSPFSRLAALAARHAVLSGEPINWLGTYTHGAERLLLHLERQQVWAA